MRCLLYKGKRSDKIQVIGEAFGCERDLTIEVILKEREPYGLYFEVDWNSSNNAIFTRDIVISGYS